MKTEQVLAFDFGLKHIGVAVGQSVTGTASPVATLKASKGKPEWSAVRKLVKQWPSTRLLVGLPLNMDGTESEMSERARAFADELARKTGLATEMVDERLSSFEAKQLEAQRSGGHDLNATESHAVAAMLIAETWLRAGGQRR